MRAIWLFVALAGCGFTGTSAGGGNPPATDGSTTVDGAQAIDAAPSTVDAPVQPPDAPPDAPAANSCGSGYVTIAGAGTSTYRKVNTPAQWNTAKTDCENDGNGAHLVIPTDKAEGALIYAYVNPDTDSPYFWAGIEDMNDDGVWKTVLGDTYANPPWGPSQPDNDDCVLIGSSGSFYDWACNASQEYACECPP